MEAESVKLLSKDGTNLHGMVWDCESPKAIVCLVHGLGEHCKRYDHVAEFFNSNNLSVFAYDQRGHGKSEGKRGHTSSHEILLDDVEELLKLARAEYNDLPIVLYGHSFGGNVVANYLLKRNTNELVTAIISSPWFRLAKEPPAIQVKMAKIVSKVLPSLTQSNGLDVNDISTDPEEVKIYANDPLVHDKLSTRLFTETYKTGIWAIENADRLKVPTLVFHGSNDNITSQKGSEEFVKNADGKATFHLWEGMKHETHNDLKKENVLNFIYDWIDSKINLK